MLNIGNQRGQKHMKDMVIILSLNIYVGGVPLNFTKIEPPWILKIT